MSRIAGSLMPVFDWTAPISAGAIRPRPSRPSPLRPAWLSSRRDVEDAAYLFTTSAKRFLDEHFESDMLKSALGWESISNTLAGPSTPGTAYNLLHEAASGGSGGGLGWGFVPGGMGVVTALMADAAREAGAQIRTGATVARIVTRGDRATGVVLADGEEIQAQRVLSNADPKRTFLTLLADSQLTCQLSSGRSRRIAAKEPA